MNQTALVVYYLVCTALSFVTYKAITSPTLRWAVLIAGVSFFALAIGNLAWRSIGGLAFLAFIAAGILFIIGVAQHQNLSVVEKTLFIFYTLMIIVKGLFKVWSINGATEMSMLCVLTMIVTGLSVLYIKYKRGGLRGKTEVVEAAGLFACFAFPMLISLFQLLIAKL
jgi:hypothetical protein